MNVSTKIIADATDFIFICQTVVSPVRSVAVGFCFLKNKSYTKSFNIHLAAGVTYNAHILSKQF